MGELVFGQVVELGHAGVDLCTEGMAFGLVSDAVGLVSGVGAENFFEQIVELYRGADETSSVFDERAEGRVTIGEAGN